MNKNIDDLGRIVIPKFMRKYLNISKDTLLNIELEENKIIISRNNSEELSTKVNKAIECLSSPYNIECVKQCEDVIRILSE